MERLQRDVVVVGAGTAGAAAAWQLARRGLRVTVLKRRSRAAAGARWVNGVPPWTFDAAGIPRSEPPELVGDSGALLLRGRDDRGQMRIETGQPWAVDIRRLVERLQGMAVDAGAELLDRAALREVELEGDRPVAVHVTAADTGGGDRELRVAAQLFVDASGLRGALRSRIPALAARTPAVGRDHVIEAIHHTCEVDDLPAMEGFLAHHGVRPGDALGWLGVGVGLSTVTVRTPRDLAHVELLAGTAGADPGAPAARLLVDFKRRERWIGPRLFGGSGTIPVRRPYDQLGAAGVALVGNSACQVFPAHGSGTGAGLIAGRTLAEVVTTFDDMGSADAVWAYQARFHHGLGSVLAAYDVFRRMSAQATGEEVSAMLEAGLIEPSASLDALQQHMPSPGPRSVARTVLGALRAPRHAARVLPALARMHAVHALYGEHPQHRDENALRRWSRRVAALFEEAPDVV